MSLRPLPNLDDAIAMQALGKHHALRNARLDAIHALRDAVVRMQSGQCDEAKERASARAALDRLDALAEIDV